MYPSNEVLAVPEEIPGLPNSGPRFLQYLLGRQTARITDNIHVLPAGKNRQRFLYYPAGTV